MNFSWIEAVKSNPYDFFIWLNNDTFIYNNAIKNIFKDYKILKKKSIITGITTYNNNASYGGRIKLNSDVLDPIGKPQKVKYINGNFVLVPQSVFSVLGYLDKRFKHSLGDIDYGLRAINNNIGLFCTSDYSGICHNEKSVWYTEGAFSKRLNSFLSPKGTPPLEYFYFNKKHFGFLKGIKFLMASFVALISPSLYNLIKLK